MSRGRFEMYAVFYLRFRQGRRIEKPTHIPRHTRPITSGRTTSLNWRSVAERFECVQSASIHGVGNSWHGSRLADPMLRRRSRDKGWRRPPLFLADGDVFLFGSGAVPARLGNSGVVCCCVLDVVWWDLFGGCGAGSQS
jgi:hypothetical protein